MKFAEFLDRVKLPTIRAMRLMVSPEFVVHLTAGRYEVIKNAVPRDAKVIAAGYDQETHCMCITLEHASFPETTIGERLPVLESPWINFAQ